MKFYPGFDIRPTTNPLGFEYGKGVFGPPVEIRTLDSIRASLLDRNCDGPDPVYSIAMDTGKVEHRQFLLKRNLLFGVVTYASGRLGREPVRSQGHVHKKLRGNRMSPPEIYEIWTGRAIIYMQEFVDQNPGRCFAVRAGVGEVVVVPPDWAHSTISADPNEPLTFGAWCDRDYGFLYEKVRAMGGMAWFPILDDAGQIGWTANPNYSSGRLTEKQPGEYHSLGMRRGVPIYSIFENDPDTLTYISNPQLKLDVWENFTP